MNPDPLEPPRLDREGPEALRSLVRARRGRPAGADVDKIAEQLVRAGVLGRAPARGPSSEKATASWKLGAIGLAVAGGLALTWASVRHHPTPPNVADIVVPAAERAPATSSSRAQADSVAAIAVDELPSAEPSAPLAPRPRSSPSPLEPSVKPRSGAATANRATSELELLQRAQAALAADPGRSLSLTNEHVRDFPTGELVQEREMLAIEALHRLGEDEAARRRADALLARFPRTPYSAKIDMLLGRSL